VKLIATADNGIDVGKLAVGKTELSEMGEVRALWRKHLVDFAGIDQRC